MTADSERTPLLRPAETQSSLLSRLDTFRSSQTFKLVTVATSLFTDSFIYGLIVPTLPYDLPRRSKVPSEDVEFWTSALLASYGLANLIAAPILGLIAERSSNRRRPLLLGLLLQIAATLTYGLLVDVRALVAARFLQGLSAAIVYTSGLAFLVDSVGAESIGSFMGAALSAENFGLMIAPLIGGPLYNKLGRTAVVGLMLVLVMIDLVLRLLIPSPSKPSELVHEGSLSRSTSSASVESAPNDNTEGAARVTALQFLKQPRILSAAYGTFLGQMFLTTFDGVLPRFTQRNYGWSAAGAGLIFLALSLPSLTAALTGKLSDRFGPKWITLAGFVTACPAFAALIFAEGDQMVHKVILCGALAFIGLAVASITSPLASDLAIVVERQSREQSRGSKTGDDGYAQVFSILLFAQCSGIMLGPSWAAFAYKRLSWTFMASSLAVLSASAWVPTVCS